MNIRGLIIDMNGTMTDIITNEGHDEIYRMLGNLLSYQGIAIGPGELKESYFSIMKEQCAAYSERYPEFDVVGIFREIIRRQATDFTRCLPAEKLEQLPLFLAEAHRAAARFRLQLFPGVVETLTQLRRHHQLAIVSDGQSAYAVPELNAMGLLGLFDPVIISGDLGFRKPDCRLFEQALTRMAMGPDEVLYVGNDMHRDIHAAQQLGIKAVFFQSNQGLQAKEGVVPDYIIYRFPELLDAVGFFAGQGV
jgi:putative hydrolase of the HAD superfamily